MHRCPICEKRKSEWPEATAARHLLRDDHTWRALRVVAERRAHVRRLVAAEVSKRVSVDTGSRQTDVDAISTDAFATGD
jgi:hypothetical protein